MGIARPLLLSSLLFSAITSLQWSPEPADGDTIYACVGQDVTLPWAFNLSAGEDISSIEWLFKGSSEEMVAVYSNNAFQPLPAFSNRVQLAGQGRLVISHVVSEDAGNYTIQVNGGTDQSARHTVILKVSEGLPATDGRLRVTMEPDAVLDTASQQWSVALTCGHFTFTGQPPFPVEWVTPTGAILPSSTYADGDFHLHLPTPQQGGTYLCRVPQQFLTSACLHDNQTAGQASTQLDRGEVRLMLTEARLRGLEEDKLQLQQQLQSVQRQVTTFKDSLTGQTLALNASLSRRIEDLDTPKISFNAKATQDQNQSPPAHVQFDHVLYNQGNAFNNNSGNFTAPVSGTYVFIFHTQSYSAESVIKANGIEICRNEIHEFGNSELGSCPAIVHLLAGEKVWVEPCNDQAYYQYNTTSLIGFLLSDDV